MKFHAYYKTAGFLNLAQKQDEEKHKHDPWRAAAAFLYLKA